MIVLLLVAVVMVVVVVVVVEAGSNVSGLSCSSGCGGR